MKANFIKYISLFVVVGLAFSACKELDKLTGVVDSKKSDIEDIFLDDGLRECVARQTGTKLAKEVVHLVCAGVGITNIIGLEQFPNIRSLILNTNRLSNVDLSPFPNLQYLDLSANNFSQIDLSNNPELIEVFLDKNNLDSLDVSNNPNLEALVLSENNLSSLDLSLLPNLEALVLDQNAFVGDMTLGPLDLSANTKLINLNLFRNDITQIDLSNNVNLDEVDIRQNELTSIDLSNNANITELRLSDNQLTSIDLLPLDILDTVFLEHNLIKNITLPLNGKLRFAFLRGNEIACHMKDSDASYGCNNQNIFRIPQNSDFIHLDLRDNDLWTSDIDLGQNLNFTELDLGGNINMTGEFDLTLSTQMIEIRLDSTGISSLNFNNYTNYLDVFNTFDFKVITAIDTLNLDAATKTLLDAMETNKASHPNANYADDPDSLHYLY